MAFQVAREIIDLHSSHGGDTVHTVIEAENWHLWSFPELFWQAYILGSNDDFHR